MAESRDIQMSKNLTYPPNLNQPGQPVTIINKSNKIYVFKIRTNQRTAVSLFTTHGFIKPHSTLQIPIKLIQKPSATIPLKLQINYTTATEQQLLNNNSKQTLATKTELHKEIITMKAEKKKVENYEVASESSRIAQNQQNIIGMLEGQVSERSDNTAEIFKTSEVDPFQMGEQQPNSQEEKQRNHHLFRHTYSRNIELFPQTQQENLIKMDIFQSAIQRRSKENQLDQPLSSIQQEILNPFDILAKSDKGLIYPPQQQEMDSKPAKKIDQIHEIKPIRYILRTSNKDQQKDAIKQQQQQLREKAKRQQSMRQAELLQLKTKIECYTQFMADLQQIKVNQKQKIYSKWLFLFLAVISFALGALAKKYLI